MVKLVDWRFQTVMSMLIVLRLPYCATEEDFVERIFDKYGYTANGKQQINKSYIKKLVDHILDGEEYNASARICEGINCPAKEICYSPTVGDQAVNKSHFPSLCPKILFALTQDCIKKGDHDDQHQGKNKPTLSKVWGYGFLFVTLISVCSLGGIFVVPFMNKSFFCTMLMFLIALGVGALAANGLICLIPEAFGIHHDNILAKWRACSIIGGIYLFFVVERLLKIIIRQCASKDTNNKLKDNPVEPSEQKMKCNETTMSSSESSKEGFKEENSKNHVATVAWMIIFGDVFHNFIDGLSVGAAFSNSIPLGINISIAVLCEELPHELGDFAILINAGLTKKKALLFNFMSACTCYLGLIIGITISEVTNATPWILGLAGGMFLYIALADMMPEMSKAAEENKDKPLKVFFIQNAGLVCGFGVIVLVSYITNI